MGRDWREGNSQTRNGSNMNAYWWNGTGREFWLTISGEMDYRVDENLKNPYADQFSVGLEKEHFPDFSIRVTYQYKNQKNIIGYTNAASQYEMVQRVSPDNNKTYTVWNQLNPGEESHFLTNPE